MQPTLLPEYPVTVGQRQAIVFSATGPASYANPAGDALQLPAGVYLDSVCDAMTVSKTYIVRFFPSAVGSTRATWTAKWYTAAGAEVNNATNLSAESIQFLAFGGNF